MDNVYRVLGAANSVLTRQPNSCGRWISKDLEDGAAGRTAAVLDDRSRYVGAGSERHNRCQPCASNWRALQRRRSGSDVDGPRHTWWSRSRRREEPSCRCGSCARGFACAGAGTAPQTQGKVERFHGSLQRTWRRRGAPSALCKRGWTTIAGSQPVRPTKRCR